MRSCSRFSRRWSAPPEDDHGRRRAFEVLTLLMDRRYPTGSMRRSSLLSLFDQSLAAIVESIRQSPSEAYAFVSAEGPSARPGQRGPKRS